MESLAAEAQPSASSIKTCTGGDSEDEKIDYLSAPDADQCDLILFTDATRRPTSANEHQAGVLFHR